MAFNNEEWNVFTLVFKTKDEYIVVSDAGFIGANRLSLGFESRSFEGFA